MPKLYPFDEQSNTWLAVREYLRDRIDELRDVAVAVETTDEQRRGAAVRVDELKSLLDQPARYRRMSAMAAPEN